MNGEALKKKLKNGDRVYGTHTVSLGTPLAFSWMSKLELDFVFICTEHIPIDREEVSGMCQLFASRGISPMVRIPYPSGYHANMYIEGGAEGIVAPYVETVKQVKDLVGAVKYRPIKGRFLEQLLDGSRKPKSKLEEYMMEFNKNLYLIIGIESVEAINNLEELISIDGVDGVFLGPHDITCSMEIPEEYDNPEFVNIVKDVIRRCRNMNKGVGLHANYEFEKNNRLLDLGLNFVLDNADIFKGIYSLDKDFSTLRSKYGDKYAKE